MDIELVNHLDQRFTQFEQKLDAKLDKRFAEFETRFEAKIDIKLANQTAELKEYTDQQTALLIGVISETIATPLEQYHEETVQLQKDMRQVKGILGLV